MDYQKNTKENIVFGIKSLVPTKVLISIVLYYITWLLHLKACALSYNQQQVQQYMLKRHDNTICKLSLGIKKTIKAIPSSITRIGSIICIEDPKEAPGVDHVHMEEDTEVEETTIADIATTTHLIRSDATSAINLDAGQASIRQKIDNKHILNINNMPNIQESRKLYQPSITASLPYGKK